VLVRGTLYLRLVVTVFIVRDVQGAVNGVVAAMHVVVQ
jgi:hypothetical protein